MTWIFAEWMQILYGEIERPIRVFGVGKWAKGAIVWLEELGRFESGDHDWLLQRVENKQDADVSFETDDERLFWDLQDKETVPHVPSDVWMGVHLKNVELSDEVITILIKAYREILESRIASAGDEKDTSPTQKYLDELGPDSFGGDDLGIQGMYPDTADGLMLLYKDIFSDYLRITGVDEATKDLLEFERAKIHEHPQVSNYKDGLTRKQWNAIFAAIIRDMKK
jgi:hypothetical protein